MSVEDNISTYKERAPDRGTAIRGGQAAARYYALIVAWGDAHGLPSDAAYAARLSTAYPSRGERGHPAGLSVERLRLAETARAWRAAGHPKRTIAIVLLWRGEQPPSLQLLQRYENRLKPLERALRKLETVEGRVPPPRPQRDTGKRRAATSAAAARETAAKETSRCLQSAGREGRELDHDPASLKAWAQHLRRAVEARRALDEAGIPRVRGSRDAAEQEEMLLLADREERRANRLRRDLLTEGRSTGDLAGMSQRQYESLVAEYAVEPLVKSTSSHLDDALATIEAQQARQEQLGGGRRRPRTRVH